MNNQEREQMLAQAKQWILEAGAHIRESIDQPRQVTTKSDAKDLVTDLDEQTEQFFTEKIRSRYPDHYVFGEEGFGDEIASLAGVLWFVDPIDGTMNFVHQKCNFTISIGIYEDGIGELGLIYNVMEDDLYVGMKTQGAYKNGTRLPALKSGGDLEKSILAMNAFWATPNRLIHHEAMQQLVQKVRGTRSYGSAALEFAYVAEGMVDGYLTMSLMPWDIAAGIILVDEVGGKTTTGDGKPLNMLEKNTVLTSQSAIHQEIIDTYIHFK
ncbi:inositol monophosphatase family protein [Thalassobacillus sp. CUG 92003]|uniref:inositol monophosphatase family protein n=1 Tax=Thalassobacillus sp. CUG 92003 TaxID=2736641 RepID=UPI0015E77BDA|nr:inositol monophosphatase family protein [Thalassobacillus sp. CUG 92003]